jgi:hypothetical protein
MRGLKGALALSALMALWLVLPGGANAVVFVPSGSFDAPSPNGIKVGPEGHVFVAESVEEGVINEYEPDGTFVTSFGPVGEGVMSGVAIDPTDPDSDGDHNLYGYISSSNGAGNPPREIATFDTGTGAEIGSPIVLSPDPGSRRYDIATGPGSNDVYVPAELGGEEVGVRKYDPDSATPGTAVQTITCSTCPDSAGFGASPPWNVALDSAGNIYVPDEGKRRLVKFGPAGDAGPTPVILATNGASELGRGVAVDPSNGRVYQRDFTFVPSADILIRAYDSAGTHIGDFGSGLFGLTLQAGSLAVGPDGVIYATDYVGGKVQEFTPVDPPVVASDAASGVTDSEATLNATVNPNDQLIGVTDCHFEYGPTESYGETAPCEPEPETGKSDVAVSSPVGGLTPNTTYHYRIVAENPGGVSEGSDVEFTTPPGPPAVLTGAASGLSQSKATLNGTVNPNGFEVTGCRFEYGASIAYGAEAPCLPVSIGSGKAPVAVSAVLEGLKAGTTYHYRLIAENSGGEVHGVDTTLTTLADTCQTNAALCPPPPFSGGGGSTPPPSGGGSTPPPPVTKKPVKCKKGFKRKTVKGKPKCVKVKKKKHTKH